MHSLVFFEYDFGKLSWVLVNAVRGHILIEFKVSKFLGDLFERTLDEIDLTLTKILFAMSEIH